MKRNSKEKIRIKIAKEEGVIWSDKLKKQRNFTNKIENLKSNKTTKFLLKSFGNEIHKKEFRLNNSNKKFAGKLNKEDWRKERYKNKKD
jgi:predicted transglutaminase-like protease